MVLMGRVCDNIVPFRISNTLERVEIFHPPPLQVSISTRYARIFSYKN